MLFPLRAILPKVSLLVACAGASLALAACGGSSDAPTTSAPTTEGPEAGPVPPDVQVVVASTEIVVGENRLFVSVHDSQRRPVPNAEVRLRFFLLDNEGNAQFRSETEAVFLGRGIPAAQNAYSTRASFTEYGKWGIEAEVSRGGSAPVTARSQFNVRAKGTSPQIGEAPPASRNPTLDDAPIEQLTSERPTGDPDLYRLTIEEALQRPRPLMIVFSTPAFCQTRTCGPQLDAARALKDRYGARMDFIHVEVFERPDLLLQGIGQPTPSPVVLEWKLLTEPWVYVIGADGLVIDRFEGLAPESELERTVLRALA